MAVIARLARRVAVFALGCGASACSLMGLGEYNPPPCMDDETICHDLNAGRDPTQCEEYRCSPSGFGCVLAPRDSDRDEHVDLTCQGRADAKKLDCDDHNDARYFGAVEVCDHIDNDCDDLIDEEAPFERAGPEHDRKEKVHAISIGAASPDTLYVSVTTSDDKATSFTNELLATMGDELPSQTLFRAKIPDCDLPRDVADMCNFSDLAFATSASLQLGAGIHRGRCAAGQLRVGARLSPQGFFDLGASSSSTNVRYGVDIDFDSDNFCSKTGDCGGIWQPVLAMLPKVPEAEAQGLAVWIARAGRACEEDSTPPENNALIAAIGLFVDQDGVVRATGDGRSEVLGTSSADRPALADWGGTDRGAGYFLAYAADDSVQLRFLPRMGDLGAQIVESLLAGRIDSVKPRNVALALDRSEGAEPRGLAVAWRAAEQTVAFVPLAFDRHDAPHFTPAHVPIEIATDAEILEGPVLTYARDGFAREQPGNLGGGWLVLWLERLGMEDAHLMALRIAESGLQRLGPPFELAQGELSQLVVGPSAAQDLELSFGYAKGTTVHLDRLECPAAEP